ncbi:MAG: diguanylate cyclase, partial [Vicinamibacterales bacterium]
MRLIRRSDLPLALALILGAVIIFGRPLSRLLESARAVELRYGVDLLPGLTVLASVLAFHLYRKREQARRSAQQAQAEATRERLRAAELERLVALGAALNAAIDARGVRVVFGRFMPAFAGGREVWLLSRTADTWDAIVRPRSDLDVRDLPTLERSARLAIEWPAQADARTEGVVVDEDLCFPMALGDTPLGVVGVRIGPPLSTTERRAIGAAVALLAGAMRNLRLFEQAHETSLRDQLTGCFNRAYAVETLGTELLRSKRTGRPVSVLMFDIDRFKQANDEHGHLVGDAILAAVAGQCGRTLRASDIKCRWGGDEFLVILPDTPLDGAEHAGGSLTRDVGGLRVPTRAGMVSPTISVGVAVAEPGEEDPLALVGRALADPG